MRVGCSRKLSSSTAAWSLDRRSFFLEPSMPQPPLPRAAEVRAWPLCTRCAERAGLRPAPGRWRPGVAPSRGGGAWTRGAGTAALQGRPSPRTTGTDGSGADERRPAAVQPVAATGDGQERRRRGRAREDWAVGDGRAGRGSGERANGAGVGGIDSFLGRVSGLFSCFWPK